MNEPIKLDWRGPFKLGDVVCYGARHGDSYLVASTGTPKFCMAAETRTEAIAKVRRALEFYRHSLSK